MSEIPKIPAMFQMLDPMTTPTRISWCLRFNIAIIAEPNSGRDVPTAEAVNFPE